MRNLGKKVTKLVQVNPDNFKQTKPYQPQARAHLMSRGELDRMALQMRQNIQLRAWKIAV